MSPICPSFTLTKTHLIISNTQNTSLFLFFILAVFYSHWTCDNSYISLFLRLFVPRSYANWSVTFFATTNPSIRAYHHLHPPLLELLLSLLQHNADDCFLHRMWYIDPSQVVTLFIWTISPSSELFSTVLICCFPTLSRLRWTICRKEWTALSFVSLPPTSCQRKHNNPPLAVQKIMGETWLSMRHLRCEETWFISSRGYWFIYLWTLLLSRVHCCYFHACAEVDFGYWIHYFLLNCGWSLCLRNFTFLVLRPG